MKKLKNIDDFTPVDVSRFVVGLKYPATLYIKENNAFSPFLEQNTVFNALHLEKLKSTAKSKIYVANEDRPKLMAILSDTADKPLVNEERLKDYSYWKEKYFRIDPHLLCHEIPIDFSLYVQHNLYFQPLCEVNGNKTIDLKTITLPSNKDILIKSTDILTYQRYLKAVDTWAKENAKPEFKTLIARENANIVMKDIFENQICTSKYDQLKDIVESLVFDVLQHPYTFNLLLHIKKQDYYSYLHCINVGVLSMALAISIGLAKKDVQDITIGAMIHDVGKCKVPVEILNKPGRLSEFEFQIYKSHVIEGKRIVEGLQKVNNDILQPVTMHHEKLSGRGYPFKLTAERIGVAGRICAIADCYDALTTPKMNKYPLSPYNALQIICKETKDYDAKLLAEFVKMMGKV